MAYEDRKFIIINVSDVTDEMISNAMQISRDRLRKTLDGSKAMLKWDGDTPSCFDGLRTYTYNEIKTELVKSEWTSNEEG